MGNVLSSAPTRERDVDSVISESETMGNPNVLSDDDTYEHCDEHNQDAAAEDETRSQAKEEEMVEFRRQLTIKREQRKEILARHRAEKEDLEKSLQHERESKLEMCENNRLLRELLIKNNIEIPENLQFASENSEITDMITKMTKEFEILKSSNIKLRRDLADTNSALQEANSDIADLNSQNRESIKQINALKEVVTVSKTMINLREQQLNDLKNKLNEIERTLADRETNLLSADLRQEYERQLQNIRSLRGLYEERARLAEVTRQGLVRELDEHKILYQAEVKKSKELATRVEELDEKVDSLLENIDNKNIQISTCKHETNVLKAEMTVVNKLFSQVLLGNKTKQDLDKLVHRLEENHGILTQMAEKENGSEASSALPKLLLELVSQVEENEEKDNNSNNADGPVVVDTTLEQVDKNENPQSTTAEDIVENLPKVWKVLIELLSHQNVAGDTSLDEKVTTCYKSVETKSGPVLVPSVSQTYIRLKDLIIEKLGLIKEVNRMKQLNTHLETRLEEQEKRLCSVTNELSKTWHVVGRLRRHHHQLHTHEKILKYELQQKRKLLNELKEELEYCREKWEQAREKNNQSERDWRKLRAEFSSRKTKPVSPSFNNSGESGYSDERPSDESSGSNDESEHITEPLLRCKKKMKKSFETILDSSTDFNLAEREDPASDMLDVAELPLDVQENEEVREGASEPSKSENVNKNEKFCEETEDEICDITHDDSCAEESSSEQILQANEKGTTDISYAEPNQNTVTCTETLPSVPVINPTEILRNIQLQNERLAKKDNKLANLESQSAALLQKTQATNKLSEQINSTLDHLINRPTTSSSEIDNVQEVEHPRPANINKLESSRVSETVVLEINNDIEILNKESCNDLNVSEKAREPNTLLKITQIQLQKNSYQDLIIEQKAESESTDATASSDDNGTCAQIPDSKTSLENININQNETLARDATSQKIEYRCSDIDCNTASTLETNHTMIKHLDPVINEQQNANETHPQNNSIELNESNQEGEAPSTSNETNHEARFAARDLRLKSLEEQTKLLVNKVNKTTSKGVKINYKLQELHNIYGSENSRAGTPSEENEDKTNDDETNDE